ncbi:hypothetical protein [Pleurocapsa sp. PCC 7319]|uniref:hypothetical protein n=1 Tax=Pleurocapsa sp. PCC 7319 TaxID=118161 RepID=UPI00036254F9|nr:hypothetical protein [Pleurocapsa sp. PCC 7319]
MTKFLSFGSNKISLLLLVIFVLFTTSCSGGGSSNGGGSTPPPNVECSDGFGDASRCDTRDLL